MAVGLGCGAKVLKYCLFAFNLIFFIAGVVLLGIGIWLIVDKHAVSTIAEGVEEAGRNEKEWKDLADAPRAVRDVGIILAVGGAIVLLIAFLGCCGAVKEWRPLLILYAICLMLILAIEIAAAIYAAVNRSNLDVKVKKLMVKSLELYNQTAKAKSDDSLKVAWDNIMKEHKCCGVNSNSSEFAKWRARPGKPDTETKDSVPPACCKVKTDGTFEIACSTDKYKEGCYLKLKDLLVSKLGIVIGVAAAIAAIQLIGIIFALCLCKAIGDEAYA